MSRQKYTSDDVLQLIARFRDREFTIPMLRDAYLETASDRTRSIKAIQHSIYKTLLKLEGKGEITRHPKKYGRTDAYVWDHRSSQSPLEDESTPIQPQRPMIMANDRHPLLKERLLRHKSDLIAAIGEADEYEALCAEFPEMANNLQQRYNTARDTISTLLGKIRALEGVLSEGQFR